MIKNNIAPKLENLPTGHSDRIISMRLPLRKEQYSAVQIYPNQNIRIIRVSPIRVYAYTRIRVFV